MSAIVFVDMQSGYAGFAAVTESTADKLSALIRLKLFDMATSSLVIYRTVGFAFFNTASALLANAWSIFCSDIAVPTPLRPSTKP
jgi:hypothetical protein